MHMQLRFVGPIALDPLILIMLLCS